MEHYTWRKGGYLADGYEIICYNARGIKQCTFIGYFDGRNTFRLKFYSREYGGTVPKERVIYLWDLERK